ncbi:MAG: FAD-binding protein [Acidimicrobiaceae bacterium]|nr:FAD-binding protein [Acidimicrobiaceae bacterium]
MAAVTGHWRNWAGTQEASGIEIVHPHDVEEVAGLVRAATSGGRRVKAIGAGHSFTGIGSPEDVQVVLDRMTGVEAASTETGLVTVRAGTPLHQLNDELARLGLAMTNLGDIDVQTISGAISTGTHGTGKRFPGLGAQVAGLEMVVADGSVVSCSADEEPELWSAARVGLGALGLVTAVTLQTVPAFAMRAEEGPMGLDELLARFDELADTTDHFEAYWFPHTQRAFVKRNTRLAAGEGSTPLPRWPLPRWREWLDDEFLANTVFGWTIEVGKRLPSTVPPLNRFAAWAVGSRTFTDRSDRVFTSPRRVRFCEMEYAVPQEAATEVIAEVVGVIERSGMHISFPVELRVAAADDIPLSTAADRDGAYLAFHLPAATDYRRYFSLVASVLDRYAGRPHWGKLHDLDAETLRGRYPRFDEFLAVRDRVDPTGVWSNGYLDRVLGPPPARKA